MHTALEDGVLTRAGFSAAPRSCVWRHTFSDRAQSPAWSSRTRAPRWPKCRDATTRRGRASRSVALPVCVRAPCSLQCSCAAAVTAKARQASWRGWLLACLPVGGGGGPTTARGALMCRCNRNPESSKATCVNGTFRRLEAMFLAPHLRPAASAIYSPLPAAPPRHERLVLPSMLPCAAR